jgi:hypothetical protein
MTTPNTATARMGTPALPAPAQVVTLVDPETLVSAAVAKATVVMFDTVHSDVPNIPLNAAKVAGYVTGTENIEWTDADFDRFKDAGKVEINQDPFSSVLLGHGFDVESGAWTVEGAAAGVKVRENAGRESFCYVSGDELTPMVNALVAHGVKTCDIWLAHPGITSAEALGLLTDVGPWPIVAVQYAWPSTNPGVIVPGGSMTLAEANVDLSMALEDWHPLIVAPSPAPTAKGPFRHLATGHESIAQVAAERGTSVAPLVARSADEYAKALMESPMAEGTPYWTEIP